ncbi:MAG: hypothetical protein ABSF45_25470 [Terriglobia bacterium]|jgi:hypothetical protein
MKTAATAVMGAKCEGLFAPATLEAARNPMSAAPQKKPYPQRVISWWSTLNDLEWPARAIRDKIQRRADQMAAAKIDTAINFGFHYRFDFAAYFGALHGYLHDVATALHERDIQFMDHFSCNVIGRPRTAADVLEFHTHERHCVNLYPDAVVAPEAGYAGYRFNDLRETLIASGEPTYIQMYAGECLCHNNPNFLDMHKAYLRRLFKEVPLDGIHQDDMGFYGSFSTCGCPYCREKFRKQFGRELPPLADREFWGDTSVIPADWGNYRNPAFRDWVRLRYQSNADHLKMVREIIGPDKILMTCCSSSGPLRLNGMGLSAEEWVDVVDWITMENVGLSPKSVRWVGVEPEAMLHKGIAASKSPAGAPTITISYFTFPDGAYLGWAIARYWGVGNWATTLWGRLPVDPPGAKEEAELVLPYNQWETAHPLEAPGRDVIDLQLAFIRASRDNGWRDAQGRDSWDRVRRWTEYLTKNDLGYRFVTTRELEAGSPRLSTSLPLVLDGCAHVSDRVCQALRDFVARGGRLWVAPPLGDCNELAQPRAKSLLETLSQDKTLQDRVLVIDPEVGPAILAELTRQKKFVPRIRQVSGPTGWSARLRLHGQRLCLHLLNANLQGEPHPTLVGGRGEKILYRINAQPAREPLILELDCAGLPSLDQATLDSPDLDTARPITVGSTGNQRWQLNLNLEGVRLYAMVVSA